MKTLPADCTAPIEVVSMRAPKVPAEFAGYSALTQARRSTSARLRDAEYPECFVLSTIAAGVNALDRDTVSSRASRARLIQKAERIARIP